MTEVFKEICDKNGLEVLDENNNVLSFYEVMKQIYFEWGWRELKGFMNDILDRETNREEVFDD